MNSNGSVPSQVLSNVSIIAYLTLVSDRMRSLSPIVIFCVGLWHKCHLSISDIFDACVSNLCPPILYSLSSLSTFSRALGFFLARTSSPNGYDSGLPSEVCDIMICVTIYCEKDVQAVTQKSSEARPQGKWRGLKLWKKLSSVLTGHLLNMGMNNHFLLIICGEKKTKQ